MRSLPLIPLLVALPGLLIGADGGFPPSGDRFLYAGYSGKPDRDLAAGFTAAGPFYGDQKPVAELLAAGTPTIVHIGVPGHVSKNTADYDLKKAEALVKEQLERWAPHPSVVMWAVQPEELRTWKKEEMDYLDLVTRLIRERDTRKRPIYLYQCNNRDARALRGIAERVDVLGKGSYANWCGYGEHRAWIRHSIEQSDEAFRLAGKTPCSLMMPELCADPAPGLEPMIPEWVRHDVYLGLMSGAKGVLIWSLHPRKEVKKTWQTWYDGYAVVARELAAEPDRLDRAFLLGERTPASGIRTVEPRRDYNLAEITNKEDAQDAPARKKAPPVILHPWSAIRLKHLSDEYLFIANSFREPTTFEIPADLMAGAASLFTGKRPTPHGGGEGNSRIQIRLEPWEIAAFRLAKPAEPKPETRARAHRADEVFSYGQPVLFRDDFRSAGITRWNLSVDDRYNLSAPEAGRIDIVPAPGRPDGERAVRFHVPRGPNSFRAELSLPHEKGAQTRRYAARILIPETWKTDPGKAVDIVMQWHAIRGTGKPTYPNLEISVERDHWCVRRSHGSAKNNPTRENTPLAEKITPGRWTDWEIDARWSPNDDGFIRITLDGKTVHEAHGRNVYTDINESYTPYFKTGIYHPEWHLDSPKRRADFEMETNPVTEKTIYVTDVVVSEFKPTPPAPTKSR